MIYKSAILGCGSRASVHIEAYKGLKEMFLHAACDQDTERLNSYGEKYGIPLLYTDLEEMLRKERPDILHIVTQPNFREQPIELAADYGVKGVIVEKPIALNIKQVKKIKETVKRTGMKIAVNMQRRYFQSCQELKRVLKEGKLGNIHFIRCVSKGNILSMGPHMIDLLLYFLNDTHPDNVWAAAYGMSGYNNNHPAPANMLIRFIFPGDITVYCEDAETAVGTIDENEFWQHLEFDIWGDKGRAWWKQNSDWGYQTEGMTTPVIQKISWSKSDLPGQREFTRAMARWLDNEENIHLNCLKNSLTGFDTIMCAMQSAYEERPLVFSCKVDDEIVSQLEGKLK